MTKVKSLAQMFAPDPRTHVQFDAEWNKLTKEIKVHALTQVHRWAEHLKQIRDPVWQAEQAKIREQEERQREDRLNYPG